MRSSNGNRRKKSQPVNASVASPRVINLQVRELVTDAKGCDIEKSFEVSMPSNSTVSELIEEIFRHSNFTHTRRPRPEELFPLIKGNLYKNELLTMCFCFTKRRKVPKPVPRNPWGGWPKRKSQVELDSVTLKEAGLTDGAILAYRKERFAKTKTKLSWYRLMTFWMFALKLIFGTALLLTTVCLIYVAIYHPGLASWVASTYHTSIKPTMTTVPGHHMITGLLDRTFEGIAARTIVFEFINKAGQWLNPIVITKDKEPINSYAWPKPSINLDSSARLWECTPAYFPSVQEAHASRHHLNLNATELYDHLKENYPHLPVKKESILKLGPQGVEHLVLVMEDVKHSSWRQDDLLRSKKQSMAFVAIIPVPEGGFNFFTLTASALLELQWGGRSPYLQNCNTLRIERTTRELNAKDKLKKCREKDGLLSKADCEKEEAELRGAEVPELMQCQTEPAPLEQNLLNNLHDRLKLKIAEQILDVERATQNVSSNPSYGKREEPLHNTRSSFFS